VRPTPARCPLSRRVLPLVVTIGVVFSGSPRVVEAQALDVNHQAEEPSRPGPTVQVTPARPRPSGRLLPSLQEVIEKAVHIAPDVRSGQAALQVSRSSFVDARRPPLGNPYFEAVAVQATQGGITQGVPWTTTLWLPLELAGHRGRRIAESEAYVKMFEAGVDVAEASAAGDVIAAYGRAVVAAERVRVLERLLVVSREAAEIYEARMQVGDAILRDVTMARMDLGRTHALLAEARGRLAQSLAELLRLTGERYDRVEISEITPPELDLEAFRDRVVHEEESLPVVAAMEAQGRYFDHQKVRLRREAVNPMQLMLVGGKGDFGETRLGAGIAYEIPAFRSRQGERAFAEAESQRAQIEGDIRAAQIRARVEGIIEQFHREREAYQVLTELALPAADQAVEAAVATAARGKEDTFVVIFSRRERVLLSLHRLEVLERQWALLGELVQVTGELP
jgi:outer membrane protein, heavy metal efflux system